MQVKTVLVAFHVHADNDDTAKSLVNTALSAVTAELRQINAVHVAYTHTVYNGSQCDFCAKDYGK